MNSKVNCFTDIPSHLQCQPHLNLHYFSIEYSTSERWFITNNKIQLYAFSQRTILHPNERIYIVVLQSCAYTSNFIALSLTYLTFISSFDPSYRWNKALLRALFRYNHSVPYITVFSKASS